MDLVTDLLPIILAVIMAGMGMTLTPGDFVRLVQQPRSVLSILTAQVVGLPLLGIALGIWLDLTPALAVGLVLLCSCPGGTTSNLFTFLAKGNLALSITLTASAGVLVLVSIPLWVHAASEIFQLDSAAAQLPMGATVQTLFFITLLPVICGMLLRIHWPTLAYRLQAYLSRVSLMFMVCLTAGLVAAELEQFKIYLAQIGTAVVALNALAVLLGLATALLFQLPTDHSTTAMLEVGIQNSAMAIVIATSLIGNTELAIPASVYSLTMYAFGFAVVFWRRRFSKDSKATDNKIALPSH
jgi:BASS family bile acid:Na+ symporter